MSEVIQQLQKSIATCLKAGQKSKLETVRMVLSIAKKNEIDSGKDLNNQDFTSLVEKMIKQRKESIGYYEKAGRTELAQKEQEEIIYLQEYLPQQLDDATINVEIKNAIDGVNASSIKDMGNVMKILKSKLAGRADMGIVSQRIRALLS